MSSREYPRNLATRSGTRLEPIFSLATTRSERPEYPRYTSIYTLIFEAFGVSSGISDTSNGGGQ